MKGDLIEILASWPENAAEDSFRSKVALLSGSWEHLLRKSKELTAPQLT